LEPSFDPTAFQLKSGLEIHHQILTSKKLFCRCPAGAYSQRHDAEVLRHMRPTLSELGEYDGTALMEFKTRKEIIYLLDRNSVCTYEMDDTPPFPINQEAVDIAIEISLLLNCKIVGEVHVARKQYLDGSIPAGFQRTAIIGVDGWIPYRDRRIQIIQLGLEEDACREVSDIGHTVTFRTDRLSMPLIEVVTGPDMRTPEEVAEVGRIIGDLLRSTGKVRRGLGSVRQDVNVSIAGGRRVEIKGVPRIPLFPALVRNEAFRQYNLLKIRDFLHEKFAERSDFHGEIFDLSLAARRIRHRLIKKAMEKGACLKGVALRGVNGLLTMTTQPGLTFSHELSERIRVIACLDQLPNLLHTEDRSVAGLEPADLALMAKAMRLDPRDTGVLIWGPPADVQTAAQEIILRVEEAFDGVPHETRQARSEGCTDFERILPGPDRMYPDTDSPPCPIDPARVERIREILPQPPWVLQEQYESLGLAPDPARRLITHPRRATFDRALAATDASPRLAAWAFLELSRHLQRRGIRMEAVGEEQWIAVLRLAADHRLFRESLPLVLAYLADNPEEDPEDFLAAQNLAPLPPDRLDAEIRALIQRHSGLKVRRPENRPHVLMGLVMEQFLGRASGQALWQSLQRGLSD